MVHGRAPFIPGVTEGNAVTDGPVSDADAVRLHFHRQERAREEFRRADRSRRLKEALNVRIQKYYDVKYDKGDSVIYQDKDNTSKWMGPAEVMAMEGKTVWVTVNGNLRKLASCNVRPFNANESLKDSEDETEENDGNLNTTIGISEEDDDAMKEGISRSN